MEERIRFRATTRYDEEAYNALAYLMIRKLRKWPRILLLVTGLVTAFGSAVLMLYQGSISPLGLLLMMLGSLMTFFSVLAQRFCVKMMMASAKKGQTPKNTYLFAGEALCIENGEQRKRYSYASMRRVLEMSGYLFFFMDDGQLYLMALKDVKGNLKDFRTYLETRINEARQAKG